MSDLPLACDAQQDERSRLTKLGFRIVRPEYIAAMKLVAARPSDEDDLLWLLR